MLETRLAVEALVIGSGIAGAATALTLSDLGISVALVNAGRALDNGNTALAQGGIVFHGPGEDPKRLETDVFIAGRDHNHRPAVRLLARKGPQAVQDILVDRLGIPFMKTTESEWDLRLEGGHSESRILHVADYTGRAIMDGFMAALKKAPNIRLLENRTAVDLITSRHHSTALDHKYRLENPCVGAYLFNETTGAVETVLADYTMLATGGVGRLFLHTTNTEAAVGSGLTMAFRAGAQIAGAEFVQFHPTALYKLAKRRFLLSEALRGEGAKLVNQRREPFMDRYDPRADLAPRDVVTRAIMEEMLKTGAECVYLDATMVPDVQTRFPTIREFCASQGIAIETDPIPVVPAAHYFCGGVLTDTFGRTTIDRLYAVGECACTGVHGANRLASTSLLEGLLWGATAARDVAKRVKTKSRVPKHLKDSIPNWESPGRTQPEDPALIAQDWTTLRNTMWNYVGITRSSRRLARAADDLRNLNRHLHEFYRSAPLSKALIDLFHGGHAAYIITNAALRNRKSLGCHHRID